MGFGLRLASVCGCGLTSLRSDWAVAFRPSVAEELPHFADFRNHVEVEVRDNHFIFVTAGLGDDFAAGIAEITLAVKFPDAPGFLDAYAVDGAYKVAVGYGMCGLLEFP
jgi:hypothetical protein